MEIVVVSSSVPFIYPEILKTLAADPWLHLCLHLLGPALRVSAGSPELLRTLWCPRGGAPSRTPFEVLIINNLPAFAEQLVFSCWYFSVIQRLRVY